MQIAEDLAEVFVSPAPKVRLVNAFRDPFDNAVAAARTCYSPRIVDAAEVSESEQARRVRDRIARETYEAGHHTVLQHSTFQFALENVSRQLVWSLLHAHPFYNSEQVSQRYVEVGPGSLLVPRLAPAEDRLYRATAHRMMACYQQLTELLTETAAREYYALFPARQRDERRWAGAVKKKAQEAARYALPIATFTHLYHTISGLTLHRYHRLAQAYDVPHEAALVIDQMIEEVNAHDPLFLREMEDPIPLEETLEARLLKEHRVRAGGPEARAFVREFDASLCGRTSKLVDYKINAEAGLAQAVRSVLGLTQERLSDDDAILAVLSPALNPQLAEPLKLSTLSKLTRTLSHPHYSFRKKLSHAADSQDQRHRMVPGSRPVLHAQYAGGEPDVVVPELVARNPAARDLFMAEMSRVFADIDRLLSAGVSHEDALYLLPNAFPVRFEESGDLMHLHHKWTTRLCYTAQEEIWRASKEEVEQVRAVHPRIGAHLMPPCQQRDLAQLRPLCPEGPRYCGVPVWRIPVDEFSRVI
ncbi:MAG: FAD-dependent thymidylate synthase [Myxococcales bacterium]|jgi:thymidylate synthase ThyX